MNGAIDAHSSFVVSLAYFSPARRYFGRVIPVQGIFVAPSCFATRRNHNPLKSLNSFSVGLSSRTSSEPAIADGPFGYTHLQEKKFPLSSIIECFRGGVVFGFVRRRKDERFFIDMMKAAAEGEAKAKAKAKAKAQAQRSLATIGIKRENDETGMQYCARASHYMTQNIIESSNISKDAASEDGLYVGGLFLFIIANHLTFVFEAELEQSLSLGLLTFLTSYGYDPVSAAQSVNVIANTYNKMTLGSDKYLLAIGGQAVKWISAPSADNMRTLVALFNIGRRNISS